MKLARPLYERILRHGERTYPEEACGLLVGEERGSAILEVVEIANVAEAMRAERPDAFTRSARDGYVMDPREQMRATQAAEREGRAVIGVYHSHPDVGAYFSAEDKRRALPFAPDLPLYPAWIVADVKRGKGLAAKLFVWSARDKDFLEQPLEIQEP